MKSFHRPTVYEARGRRFESLHLDANNPIHKKVPQPFFFNNNIMTAMVALKLRSKMSN